MTNNISITHWYEIWANNTNSPPYVLVVCFQDAGYVVSDPKEGDRVVFHSLEYETVKFWLLEDEFVMVRGRMDFGEE